MLSPQLLHLHPLHAEPPEDDSVQKVLPTALHSQTDPLRQHRSAARLASWRPRSGIMRETRMPRSESAHMRNVSRDPDGRWITDMGALIPPREASRLERKYQRRLRRHGFNGPLILERGGEPSGDPEPRTQPLDPAPSAHALDLPEE
jgi:hypothetical protein